VPQGLLGRVLADAGDRYVCRPGVLGSASVSVRLQLMRYGAGSTGQRQLIRDTSGLTIFRLVLLLGAQQREGVLDALLEDVIRELPVGQDAGELQGADH
jgi:hypothetical protein